MEANEIKEALTTKPELLTEILPDILPQVLESDKGKEILERKANGIYEQKINDEVSKIHSRYDQDMFDILGEKPGQLDDGSKQKTYDKTKQLYSELKTLREQKASLSVDAEVKRLQKEIEKLQTTGAGAHWEQTFNTEKTRWQEERKTLTEQLASTQKSITDFKKRADIEAGLRGMEFRSDIPESARKALIDMAVNNLISRSKVENDRVIYLDENGAQINDAEYRPQNAKGILTDVLKDIIKTDDRSGGGGAPPAKGTIVKTNHDGKEVARLELNTSQFSTKSEFLNVAEKALAANGIQRGEPMYDQLKNEAYTRYKVGQMPR